MLGILARIGVVTYTIAVSGIVSLPISNKICVSNKLNHQSCELVQAASFGVVFITAIGVLSVAATE